MTNLAVSQSALRKNHKPAEGKRDRPVSRQQLDACYPSGCRGLETGFIDRESIRIAVFLAFLAVLLGFAQALPAVEIQSGTTLEIRLLQTVSSYSSKRRQVLRAVLIRPVETNDTVLLPAGTELLGTIARVRKVGLGLIWERARIDLHFDTLVLPENKRLSIHSRVVEVENAREVVRLDGEIQGIRASASPAYRASGLFTTITAFDPMLMLLAFSSSSSILRSPDSEIYYPAGTELELKLTQPLPVARTYPPAVPPLATTLEEKEELARIVAKLPFQTRTPQRNKPSDLTNLIFLGTEIQIEKAFAAAGWSKSEELNAHTRYKAIRAAAEQHGYSKAPMSVLTLDEHIPHLTYEKSLNTISKRHHLRIWDLPDSWDGQSIWTAAATRDIGMAFSKKDKRFIHRIEHNIDNERSKVASDLVFANCVDALELVDRPYVPRYSRNGTDEPLLTDGRITVLRLNACDAPRPAAESLDPEPIRSHGNLLERGGRRVLLSVYNDLIRNNVAWQAYGATRFAIKRVRGHKPTTHETSVADPLQDATQ